MYIEWMIYVLIGAISGFLAGLLGIGGGVVVVPALFFFMGYFGISPEHLMHITIATSLASMIFSALSSTIAHQKRHNIQWNIACNMILGLIVGSGVGAYIAQLLSSKALVLIFGLFLSALGVRCFIPESPHKHTSHFVQPHFFYCNCMGFSISCVAALLGIGGGLFTVPLLTACKMRFTRAIGTSSAISFMITVIGSIFYFILGLNKSLGGQSAFGFIYLPAFLMISVSSFIFAPLGVKTTHTLNPQSLQRIFGGILVCVGMYMIIRGFF